MWADKNERIQCFICKKSFITGYRMPRVGSLCPKCEKKHG